MRILSVSGGSAGHLAPLVAVAREMLEMQPDVQIDFACSDRPEDASYLRSEHIEPALILKRPARNWRLGMDLFTEYSAARQWMKKHKPDAVFSKGAAVSVPVCFAAKRLSIPVVIHESDAVMGSANRLTARWAAYACFGFKTAADESPLPAHKKIVTGNPIRKKIMEGKAEQGRKITGFSGQKPVLLVTGGSQGAQALNDAVYKNLDELLLHCDIVHLTGRGKRQPLNKAGYWSAEFVTDELPHLLAIADIALTRGGNGSIAELAATGVPAIIVPIKGLANDHQVKNAEIAAAHGGCQLLLQQDLEEKLMPSIAALTETPDTLQKMSQKIRSFQQPDAARRIAEILSQCIARRHDRH